jgi:hypothetical protein
MQPSSVRVTSLPAQNSPLLNNRLLHMLLDNMSCIFQLCTEELPEYSRLHVSLLFLRSLVYTKNNFFLH